MKKQGLSQQKKCLLCVTKGSEEIEFATVFDCLRRTPNYEVIVAKVPSSGEQQLSTASDLKSSRECLLMQGLRIVSHTLMMVIVVLNIDSG